MISKLGLPNNIDIAVSCRLISSFVQDARHISIGLLVAVVGIAVVVRDLGSRSNDEAVLVGVGDGRTESYRGRKDTENSKKICLHPVPLQFTDSSWARGKSM